MRQRWKRLLAGVLTAALLVAVLPTQAMASLVSGPLLCLDGVGMDNGDYLDIGAPVAGESVLPIVIKTIAFHK